MRLDQLRDYLTLPEVAHKWKATDPEMCRAVLKGLLRPSLYIDAELLPARVDRGRLETGEERTRVCGWHYLTFVQQVGALDCVCGAVSVTQEYVPGVALWALDEPLRMRDVLAEGVVMAEDLLRAEELLEAESCWQQRSAKTKEINSVLNILAVLLADCYRFDPRSKNTTSRDIEEASHRFGLPVSEGTVRKWIRQAMKQYPPSYMAKPLTADSQAAD